MAASIIYRSASVVQDDISSQVKDYISESTQGYEWWCEPITFFDHPEFPGRLYGASKLFCLLDDTEEGVAHDSFMADTDMSKIASILSEVSRKYGLDWILLFEGQEIGGVKQGELTPEFEEQTKMHLEVCTIMEVDPGSLNREEILKIYKDR